MKDDYFNTDQAVLRLKAGAYSPLYAECLQYYYQIINEMKSK